MNSKPKPCDQRLARRYRSYTSGTSRRPGSAIALVLRGNAHLCYTDLQGSSDLRERKS